MDMDSITKPAVDKFKKTTRPATEPGAPHGGRRVTLAVLIAAIALTALLLWWRFLSPVTISPAPLEFNVREQVYGLGEIGARVQSNVGFKVAGVLAALYADQGDRVRAGQVLARLDARDIEAQVAQAKAGVAQARANIVKAKADIASATANRANAARISARDARLLKKGTVSEEQAETNESAVRVTTANLAVAQGDLALAEAALQSAQAQESFAEATLSYYTLYAPYDAWIISRNLELGSMPNPGQSVFTLVKADTVWGRGLCG
jgi:HlyD family secretion protein